MHQRSLLRLKSRSPHLTEEHRMLADGHFLEYLAVQRSHRIDQCRDTACHVGPLRKCNGVNPVGVTSKLLKLTAALNVPQSNYSIIARRRDHRIIRGEFQIQDALRLSEKLTQLSSLV